jgi:hypothetical protein
VKIAAFTILGLVFGGALALGLFALSMRFSDDGPVSGLLAVGLLFAFVPSGALIGSLMGAARALRG